MGRKRDIFVGVLPDLTGNIHIDLAALPINPEILDQWKYKKSDKFLELRSKLVKQIVDEKFIEILNKLNDEVR